MSVYGIIAAIVSTCMALFQVFWGHHQRRELETDKAKLQEGLEESKAILQRDLETHKATLQTQLQITAGEYESRFSLLHQKRFEFVGELYARAAKVANIIQHITSPFVIGDMSEEERAEKKREAVDRYIEAYIELQDYLTVHRVFLDATACKKLDELLQKLWVLGVDFGMLEEWRGNETAAQFFANVQEGRGKIPGILVQIETELRSCVSADIPVPAGYLPNPSSQSNRPQLPPGE